MLSKIQPSLRALGPPLGCSRILDLRSGPAAEWADHLSVYRYMCLFSISIAAAAVTFYFLLVTCNL
jgi:hypothetical protein